MKSMQKSRQNNASALIATAHPAVLSGLPTLVPFLKNLKSKAELIKDYFAQKLKSTQSGLPEIDVKKSK